MRHSRRQLPPSTRSWPAGRPSATTALVAVSVAAAAAQWMFMLLDRGQTLDMETLQRWIGLGKDAVSTGQIWKFVTFPLIHSGPFHLLGNMLVLYFAGREVEPIIGARHLLGIYLTGTFVGGLAHWCAALQGWVPGDVPLLGVSAGVLAVLVAFATILPQLDVTLLLFFVLPLRMRAKTLGLGATGVAGLLWVTRSAPEVGPVAMLAGSALSWWYVKQLGYGSPLAIQRYFIERRQRAQRLDRMPAEQFISEEIDPILDKISREGMHSLSRAERKALEKGREKIAAKTATRR